MGTTTRPEKCDNCKYSTRHSRQQPGEVLQFCGTCSCWLCEGCRVHRECYTHKHRIVITPIRTEVMTGVPANDGVYEKVSEEIYHGDKDSLSSSGARLLLPPSTPAHFRAAVDEPRDPNKNYDYGHVAHKMVLGEGGQIFMLDPAIHGVDAKGNLSAKPASCGKWIAASKAARNKGQIPMAKSEIQKAQRMAGRVYEHPLAQALLLEGKPEVSGYWHDDETGVRLRVRFDYLPDRPGRLIIVDYKTAEDASQDAFERACASYGYHIQDAWYREAARQLGLDDDPGFIFIVQEKKPPYEVNVIQLDPEHVELGARQARRAIRTFAECRERKQWPGYGDGPVTAKLPAYAVKRIEQSLNDEVSTLTGEME